MNVGGNLLFVPRYGVMVAAVMTAVGYGVSAVLHGCLAQYNHPVPWQYGRWARLFVAGLVAFFVAARIGMANPYLAVVAKSAAAMAVFVVVLALTGFIRRDDLARIRGFLRRRR